MMSTPLWNKCGNCFSDWKDDTLPEFGPFKTDELKEGMVFWGLHLTNYSHNFVGRACARTRAVAHQALVMATKGLWCTPWLRIKHWSGRVGLARARLPIPTHNGSVFMGQACTQC